jgi:hypothetical protein
MTCNKGTYDTTQVGEEEHIERGFLVPSNQCGKCKKMSKALMTEILYWKLTSPCTHPPQWSAVLSCDA